MLSRWRSALDLGEPAHTITEAADQAGIDVVTARRLWRGLGLPEPNVNDRHHTRDDVEALQRLSRLLEDPVDDLVQEIRFISLHLAAVAEAEVDYLKERLRVDGSRHTLISDVLERGFADSDYAWLMLYALRRQLDAAAARHLAGTTDSRQTAAVGFVDIVGFTRFVSTATRNQIGDVLDVLERSSIEAAAASNVRVVKFIGDEVMLIASRGEAIVHVAQRIAHALARHGNGHAVHGGLATGPATPRGGDLVGPVVNLAHRLSTAAPSGILLQAIDGKDDDPTHVELPDIGRIPAEKHQLT